MGHKITGRRRRRRHRSSSPLENDDILSEILLSLPPTPSSLPEASLVCKRWHRVVNDPGFLRRFHARHCHNPPLVGFLKPSLGEICFDSILDPPYSIPRERFWLSLDGRSSILSCRHGLVLIHNLSRRHQILVWDPITFDMHWVAYPQELSYIEGSVLRTTSGINDGEGTAHFQVVLVGKHRQDEKQVIASVYSSETGEWGDLISTPCPSMGPVNSGVLVGARSVCWLLVESHLFGILEFDMDRQRLAVIEMPEGMSGLICHFTVIQAQGGGLGFLHLSSFRLDFWKWKTDADAGWLLGSSVELDKLLSPSLDGETELNIYGYVDDSNELLLATNDTIFVIQLDSMELKTSFEIFWPDCGHPFSCVYAPGI